MASIIESKQHDKDLFYQRVLCVLLICGTLASYWGIHHFDFVNFDDHDYVYENAHIRTGLNKENLIWAFTAVHSGNWHPITSISHMFDVELFGLNAGGHHTVNLAIHIANVLLLFFVLIKATNRKYASFFVAALFALHPLHVESVAWVSERKDLLCTFFGLLTFLAYLRSVVCREGRYYLLALACFALGLMSKPMLVTLPFLLLLFDYWPLARFSTGNGKKIDSDPKGLIPFSQLLLEKFPFLALTTVSCIVTVLVQRSEGAMKPLEHLTFFVRFCNAMVSYIVYITKMIWPFDLAVYYPHQGMPPAWKIIGAIFLLAGFSYISLREAKKRPYFLVGWLWYLGTLVPVIGLVQVGGQALADRYTYIPFIGLFIIIAWGTSDLVKTWPYKEKILVASTTVILVMLAILTRVQVGYWRDSISLFEHTLDVTQNNYKAHFALGIALGKENRIEEAMEHYKKASLLDPRNPALYYEIGVLLEKEGKLREALKAYDVTIQLEPLNGKAHNNLGRLYFLMGDLSRAIYHLELAQKAMPQEEKIRRNLEKLKMLSHN